MKIQYNSPVILTFSLAVIVLHLVNTYVLPGITYTFFMAKPTIHVQNPWDYFRLFSHVFGHSGWTHILGNLTLILLLGPILEEKYGSGNLLLMIVITSLVTGIIHVVISVKSGLLGASGIVFMLIVLASIVDIKRGSIPLTFVLVAGIFIGGEVFNTLNKDNISQMAHILGGISGAFFGFFFAK
ncbi:MAG: rhomboid family intramembrane serine protease [Desulfobacterales bacterium]|nr:rhomboid family intramembrane serine protease [Desulfobacterales bacterium]